MINCRGDCIATPENERVVDSLLSIDLQQCKCQSLYTGYTNLVTRLQQSF